MSGAAAFAQNGTVLKTSANTEEKYSGREKRTDVEFLLSLVSEIRFMFTSYFFTQNIVSILSLQNYEI